MSGGSTMARLASRKVIDALGALLRRNGAIGDEDIRIRTFAHARSFAPPAAARAHEVPDGALVADEPSPHEVRERLSALMEHVAAQVRAAELPHIDLPHRHRTNAIYDQRGNVFVGGHVRTLSLDRHDGQSFVRVMMALETASQNLRDGARTSLRGLYYRHRHELDHTQEDTDRAIVSLASVLRVRRRALGFVEAPRGFICGRLVIRDGDETVDLAKLGPSGRVVPRFDDRVEILSSDAKVIVIVEKHAIAQRLAESRWCDAARCILLCGYGFPSVSTRELVRKLTETLRIPAVIFADADPAGVRLALTYAHGSISTALETPWLACNQLRWAGMYPSDYERHFTKRDEIRLSEDDRDRAREMIEHPSRAYVNDRIRKELAILVDRGFKVELDTLCRDSRLVDYMQHKLDSDLIEL